MQQAVATVRGLAMLDTLHPDGERNRQQWSFCRARLAELFLDAARRAAELAASTASWSTA